MRNKLAIIFCVLLLGSCASTQADTETNLSYRQQLDIYKDMKIRLYQVAAPIKRAGGSMCDRFTVDTGNAYHQVSDYPENMRAVAQSYWGLTGDLETLFYQKQNHVLNCYAPLVLGYEKLPQAHTDGESIFITSALLSEVDDLSLALIIAHELAHIALNHIDKEPSDSLEREADRFAVFMLARAKLDYHTAVRQDAASKKPRAQGKPRYTDTQKRAEHFRKVVLEIEALQAGGRKLIP